MKKTIIGAVLAICGTIITTCIIITASTYCATLTSWTGSKFWYAVFGTPNLVNEVNLSLNLGLPFVFGSIILLMGVIILVVELFGKPSK
jgi:hypothetical protein